MGRIGIGGVMGRVDATPGLTVAADMDGGGGAWTVIVGAVVAELSVDRRTASN